MIKDILIVSILGYAFGCLQWSYILIRIFKRKDIRTQGFGNAGASNTMINYGKKFGLAVAILDGAKAIFSILLIRYLMAIGVVHFADYLLILNGIFVIIGHNFPFFMNFKGGKGTASLIGLMIAINPWMGLLSILVIIAFSIGSNYIAIGTFALLLFFVLTVIVSGYSNISILLSLVVVAMSIFLHIPNYQRIIKGEETKVRDALFKNKK